MPQVSTKVNTLMWDKAVLDSRVVLGSFSGRGCGVSRNSACLGKVLSLHLTLSQDHDVPRAGLRNRWPGLNSGALWQKKKEASGLTGWVWPTCLRGDRLSQLKMENGELTTSELQTVRRTARLQFCCVWTGPPPTSRSSRDFGGVNSIEPVPK